MYQFYVYILLCADRSYYVGVTVDLNDRFLQHENGEDPECYTYTRRPVILVYYEEYEYINDAIAREKQLKGWSRSKKEALMKADYILLAQLSRPKKEVLRQAQHDRNNE